MPNKIVATCPACQTRYKIKVTMSGRKAKCGKCQTRMRIPTLRAKLHEAVSKTAQRARSAVSPGTATSRSNQTSAVMGIASTKAAGVGMLMCAWSSLIALLTAGTVIGLLVSMPDMLLTYQNQILGTAGGASLLGLIGLMVCGSAPKESRSRFYVLSAIFLALLNIGVGAYAAIANYNGFELIVPELAINLTNIGLGVVTFFCFMIFTAKIARYIQRTELSATARGVIWIQTLILSVAGGLAALVKTDVLAVDELTVKYIVIGIMAAAAINQVIMIVLQFQLGSALRKN